MISLTNTTGVMTKVTNHLVEDENLLTSNDEECIVTVTDFDNISHEFGILQACINGLKPFSEFGEIVSLGTCMQADRFKEKFDNVMQNAWDFIREYSIHGKSGKCSISLDDIDEMNDEFRVFQACIEGLKTISEENECIRSGIDIQVKRFEKKLDYITDNAWDFIKEHYVN
jgi:hypothetical protein